MVLSMAAYLQQKCIFIFNENVFLCNKKYLAFEKIYLYSIKYISIQQKIFTFDKKHLIFKKIYFFQ